MPDVSKKLLRAIENALALSSLTLPLPSEIVELVAEFRKTFNNDQSIKFLEEHSFMDSFYDLCLKYTAKDKSIQIPLSHLVTLLSPFIIDLKSLLFWLNEHLTYALNSPGLSNDLVIISRYFLKLLLQASADENCPKLSEIRLRNACVVFRTLLDLYMDNDGIYYKQGHITSISVDQSWSHKISHIDGDNGLDEHVKSLESFEAKRFINLNIRPLLLEFMLYSPRLAFTIFNDYLLDPKYRLDTLLLVLTLLNPDSSVLSVDALCSDPVFDGKKEPTYLQSVANVICSADQESRASIADQELASRLYEVYSQNMANCGDFKFELLEAFGTGFVRSLCNILFYDFDVVTINFAMLLLVCLVPSLYTDARKLLPVLLAIFGRLGSYERNINSFAHFDHEQTEKLLDSCFLKICPEQPQNLPQCGSESSPILRNTGLETWTCVFVNVSSFHFEYSQASKLYSLLYGLYPNTLTEFIKSPSSFFSNHFKLELQLLVESSSVSFFAEEDLLVNTERIAENHTLNTDLFRCTVSDELERDDTLSWQTLMVKNANCARLLWRCLKFDRMIYGQFTSETDLAVSILRYLIDSRDYSASAQSFMELLKLYKTQIDLQPNVSSPVVSASLLSTPILKPQYNLSKRKHSVQLDHDVGGILNKQTQLFVAKAELSPASYPISALNLPNLAPLDPEPSFSSKTRSEEASFYRRELLLLKNDYDFCNNARCMATGELVRKNMEKSVSLLDATRSSELAILKLEDRKNRREQVQQDVKRLTKALAAARANSKIQEAVSTQKIGKLKDEVVELKAEVDVAKKQIGELELRLQDVSKEAEKKGSTVVALENEIKLMKEEQELVQISNEVTEQPFLEAKYDYRKAQDLRDRASVLTEQVAYLKKEMEVLQKKEEGVGETHRKELQNLERTHRKQMEDLEAHFEAQLSKRRKELEALNEKYRKMKKMYSKAQSQATRIRDEMIDVSTKPILLRDDMVPSVSGEFYELSKSISGDEVRHKGNGLYLDAGSTRASVQVTRDDVTIDSRITKEF